MHTKNTWAGVTWYPEECLALRILHPSKTARSRVQRELFALRRNAISPDNVTLVRRPTMCLAASPFPRSRSETLGHDTRQPLQSQQKCLIHRHTLYRTVRCETTHRPSDRGNRGGRRGRKSTKANFAIRSVELVHVDPWPVQQGRGSCAPIRRASHSTRPCIVDAAQT